MAYRRGYISPEIAQQYSRIPQQTSYDCFISGQANVLIWKAPMWFVAMVEPSQEEFDYAYGQYKAGMFLDISMHLLPEDVIVQNLRS